MISHPFSASSHMWVCCNCTLSFSKVEKKATNEILGWVIQQFFFCLAICREILSDIILFIPALCSFSYSASLHLCSSTCVPFLKPDNQSFWLRLWRFSSFHHVFVFLKCPYGVFFSLSPVSVLISLSYSYLHLLPPSIFFSFLQSHS